MTKTRTTAIALLTAKAALGASLALGLTLSPHGTAHASPVDTINLTDVHDIGSLPVCTEEDCSDQLGQVGVWLDRDTGDWYLERGEDYTRRIIDNTVGGKFLGPDTVGSDPADDPIGRQQSVDIRVATGAYAWDMGTYVGGFN